MAGRWMAGRIYGWTAGQQGGWGLLVLCCWMAGHLNGWVIGWLGDYMAGCHTTGRLGAAAWRLNGRAAGWLRS
jgi:hypothetical protein